MRKMIRQSIEDKSIIWFSNTNQYLVLEHKTADILDQLHQENSHEEIAKQLSEDLDVHYDEALKFVHQIDSDLYKPNSAIKNIELDPSNSYSSPKFTVAKYYQIHDWSFSIEFQSEFEQYLVHPKFAHLEVSKTSTPNTTFKVFTENDITYLLINDQLIGSWHRKNIHYFQGKLSMYIVQFMHDKPEDDWMGIFHASGLGNDQKSLLLLGDSGNGKSTSLALLQASGLTCLADDFVPMDIEKKHVYTFPSAISIKKNSLKTLLPFYPELEHTAEYHFKRLNKIVRFLPPNIKEPNFSLPCNDLVFIKYQKDSDLQFNKIANITAFEQLIPDSWISSKSNNVEIFLDWFATANCYQLTYSNNTKMVETIKNLLNDEL
jgi:hypothetical protein